MIAVSETANALGPLRVCSRLEPSWNGRQRVIALDGTVMSVQPDWLYDDFGQQLLIHNPIERYHAGVVC